MSVNGANANADGWSGAEADGATVKLTVKGIKEQWRSVGGDDLGHKEWVQNERQRALLLFWEVKSMGSIEMWFFTEYVQYLYWKPHLFY
jgi:hypothetical protein